MHEDRLARIVAGLGGTDARSALERLADVCVEILSVTAASVAVVRDGEHRGRVALAGASAAAVDELQFSLGEGPSISADRSLSPILEPDLAHTSMPWPAFAPAALGLGIAAAFAFPLRVGTVHLGVLTLYRASPGDLDAADLADAVAISRIATHLLLELERDLPPGSLPDRLEDVLDHRASVHQATGMIAAQIDADVATALSHLRAFAWSRDLSVADVAAQVIARQLRFDGA
ncbi:MAG: ANTAR domain-containing protein [Acidimicrobiales bacterium]